MTEPAPITPVASTPAPLVAPRSRFKRWLLRLLLSIIGAVILWALLILVLENAGQSEPAPYGKYDLIIVAGAGVMPDGSPSAAQYARTIRGVQLFKAGFAPKMLFTGGPSPGGVPAESEVAAKLAESHGVPRSAMILESRSRSTYENAIFAHEAAPDAHDVLLVTDSYHVPRAKRVFARFFPHVDATPAFTPLRWRIGSDIREVPKFAGYFLLGRM